MISNNEIELVIQDMWNVANKIAEKIDVANKKNDELQMRFAFLDNTITRKNENIKQLEGVIKENLDTINEKNNKLAFQYNEIERLQNLQSKHSELETNYIKIINENSSLKFEMDNLRKSNTELETLKKDYSELSTNYEELNHNFNDASQKLNQQNKEHKDFEIIKKELMTSKYEIINRNEQINKLKIAVSEQQSININLSKQIKLLQEKENQHINEIENKKNEIDLLKDKNILLGQDVEKVSLEGTNKFLDYVAKLENIKNELNHSDIIRLNDEVRIKELELQLLKKQNELEEKEKILEENNVLKENNVDINKGVLKQIEEYEKIIQSLNLENKNNAISKNKLEVEFENKIKKLTNNLFALEKDNKKYIDKVDELQQQLLSVGNIEFTRKETHEIAELVAENNKLTNIITQLKDELDTNKAGFKHLTTENEKLQKILSDDKKYKIDTDKDSNKLSKLSKAIENLNKNNKELIEQNDNLQSELRSYKKRIYDSDSMFADIHRLENKETENNYEEQILKLEDENKLLQNKISKLENKDNKTITTNKNTQKDELVVKIGEFLTKLESKI